MEQIRNSEVYGIRPKRTFRQAATKYLNEASKKSLAKDAWCLERIDPFIGNLYLENVHMGTLRPYIEHGQKKGWKNRTINMPMEVVRRILNLAASEWLDENALTWLQAAPKIRLLSRSDARPHRIPCLGKSRRDCSAFSPLISCRCVCLRSTRDSEIWKCAVCAGMIRLKYRSWTRRFSSFQESGGSRMVKTDLLCSTPLRDR